MIANIGKLAVSAGKAIGKFAMDHKEDIAKFGKEVASAAAMMALDAIRKKLEEKSDKKSSKLNLSKD